MENHIDDTISLLEAIFCIVGWLTVQIRQDRNRKVKLDPPTIPPNLKLDIESIVDSSPNTSILR